MGILVAVTTYQPLMNVRLLLIGILKLAYYSCYFNIDLMQFRLDNTVDTSLTWQVFLVFFYSITAKGIDLSEIVTGVIFFH
jgi:hypothetical protein